MNVKYEFLFIIVTEGYSQDSRFRMK